MSNKVFKVTFSAIYNDENMTPDKISDNLFEALQKINDTKLVCLHIDDIKEMKNANSATKNVLKKIMDNQDNKEVIDKETHVEIISKKED